jgi:CBS domain containing-hemolysin-like protein
MSLFVVSLALTFSIAFLCSILEAVLLSLTPGHIADLARANARTSIIWQGFKSNIERPIAVILIVNTAAHTIGATVAGAEFEHLFGRGWIGLYSILFTYAMLQFTEILPKTAGVRFNRQIAPYVTWPLHLAGIVLSPLIHFIHFMNRPFTAKPRATRPDTTLEEISALAGLARLSNLIDPYQEKIIQKAWRLSALPAREAMIPLGQITFLDTRQNFIDALLTAHMDPHTRFPICEAGDHDHVIGYVNFKEMVTWARTNPGNPSLRGITRPVHFTPPDESCAELLRVFVEQHVHMAIVRSEAGTTLGLVTLEDIVEELVGELQDEFDYVPRMCHALSGGTWMVGGGFPIAELASRIGVSLPDAAGSVSAWLIRRIGQLPKPNEVHREHGIEFTVRRIRRRSIFEVMVTRKS